MDFNEEIAEFLKQKYILSFEIKKYIDPISALCVIITLESITLQFVWSKSSAIKLTHVNEKEIPSPLVYETIEGLLTEHSKKYKEAFGGDLFAKLAILQKEQEGQEEQGEQEEQENSDN